MNERGVLEGLLEWSALGSGLVDHDVSGDAHLVVETSYGALVVVVDALGHGPGAAETARVAIDAAREALEQDLHEIVAAIHHRVRPLRGVVASLARLDRADSRLTWLGVGNVSGVIVHKRGTSEAMPQRGGVIGGPHVLPRTGTVVLSRGDVLIFSTDGVRDGYSSAVVVEHDIESISTRILGEHARGTDDSLVLVAKYLGPR